MHGREDELFRAFQRTGDPAALGQVYDLVATELLGVALHLSRDPAEAEDVLQQTFIVAIERAADFDPERRVRPWLTGILARQAKLARQRSGRSPDPHRIERTPPQSPAATVEGIEVDERVDAALERVPDPFRTPLILRLRHGMTAVEIARALARPPGTVRSQLARGIDQLKRALPKGLVGASLLALSRPARGLDAVREAVVGHAASQAAAASTALLVPTATKLAANVLGAIAVKNALLGVATTVLAAVGVFAMLRVPETEPLTPDLVAASAAPAALEGVAEPRVEPGAPRAVEASDATEARRSVLAGEPEPEKEPDAATSSSSLVVEVVWEADDRPAVDELVIVNYRAEEVAFFEEVILRTDARGIARLAGRPASTVTVHLLRGRFENVHLPEGDEKHIRMTIPEGVTVAGSVVDELERPVPRAEVWVSQRWSWNKGHTIARADDAGRFEVGGLTSDHYIGARAEGFALSYVQHVRAKKGETKSIRIVLEERGAGLEGTVRDAVGEPVAGAIVMVGDSTAKRYVMLADGSSAPSGPPQRATTDADGRFMLASVRFGSVPVRVRARGFATWTGDATIQAARNELAITLAPDAAVVGTVTDAQGNPVPHAVVHTPNPWRFDGAQTVADRAGRFILTGLTPGQVQLVAQQDERGYASHAVTLGPADRVRWDPVLELRPRVFGTLVDGTGEPAEDHAIVLSDESSRQNVGSTRTGANGTFSIDVPEGSSLLLAVNDRRGWRYFPRLIVHEVTASTQPLALTVPGPFETGTIVAELLDPDGAVPKGMQVDVWHREHRMFRTFDVSGETGHLVIDVVPPGTVDVSVRGASYPTVHLREQKVVAGTELELGTIALSPSGRLVGTLSGVPDEALESVKLALYGLDGGTGTVQRFQREFTSTALEPGRWRVTVSGDFLETAHRYFELEEGSETRVDIEMTSASLRRIVFEHAEAGGKPRWIGVNVVNAAGKHVWSSGAAPQDDGTWLAKVSAQPGTYSVRAKSNLGLEVTATFDVPEPAVELPDLKLVLAGEAGGQ